MPVRLTERDRELVAKCAVARCLTTRQVQKLFFRVASPDAVRKRLRKLAAAGYLRSWQPNPMAERLHAVGTKGKLALEGIGTEVTVEKAPPKQLEHLMGINDIRVAVERGDVRVGYFFAAWELGKFGWGFAVIPDAVFTLGADTPATFLVEYDRGTETVGELVKKVRSYERALDGFPFDALLIISDTAGRLQSLARELRKRARPEKPVLGALLGEIRGRELSSPVFAHLGVVPDAPTKISLKDFGDSRDPALSK